jgi:DNA-binding MarR family transcriptional regulator
VDEDGRVDGGRPEHPFVTVVDEQSGHLATLADLVGRDLARRAFVTPQSMNEVLKQLESTGLIERRRNPTNARILNAYLTRTGSRKRSAVSSQVRELEARLLSGLTSDERQTLNRALLIIIDNVTRS